MKSSLIATAAVTVAVVSAQTSNLTIGPASSLLSTYTEYYNTCTSSEEGTATDTLTQTYCPICEAMSMSTYPGGSLTTYTTVYQAQCPTSTGLEDKTYTITEPCPSAGAERASDYIPQGFTVATVPCGCAENTPVAITTPGPAYSAAAKNLPAAALAVPTSESAPAAGPAGPAGPAGAPGAPGSPAPAAAAPGAAPAAAPAGGAPAGSPAQAPATGGAPAEAAAAGAPAAPPPYPVSPAINAAAAATGSGASNASAPKAFTGSATTTADFSMSFFFGLIGLIAPFAFAL